MKYFNLQTLLENILSQIKIKVFTISLCSILFTSLVWAQSGSYQNKNINLDHNQLTGFSNDGRVKVLLLNLLPSGMTETAAQEIVKALQLNIYNTNHFTVVGPSEWNIQIKDSDPTLTDCQTTVKCLVL